MAELTPASRLTQEDDPFILLVLDYLDGTIGREDLAQLDADLTASEARRRLFMRIALQRRMMLEGYGKALRDSCDSAMGEDEDALLALQMLREQERGVSAELVELDERVKPDTSRSSLNRRGTGHRRHSDDDSHEDNGAIFSFAGISVYRKTHSGDAAGLRIPVRRIMVAALLAVAAFGAWMLWQPLNQTAQRPPETTVHVPPSLPPVVAQIDQTYAATWDRPDQLSRGVALRQGDRFTLTAGYAALRLARGATVILEAPCSLELRDDNTVQLSKGKLVAHVPEAARQFAVLAPFAEIVDLGTEFGVEVLENGTSNVHVFDGVVEMGSADEPDATERLTLEQSQSAAADGQTIRRDESLLDKLRFMRFRDDSFGDSVEFASQQLEAMWLLNGDATAIDEGVRLTRNAANRVGTMFARRPIRFDRDMSFQAYFVVRMSDPGVASSGTATPAIGIGGDGMAFVLHTDAEAITKLGVHGHALGIDHLSPAFAIVLDTWSFRDREHNEPEGEYVGVRLHGQSINEAAQRVPFLLNDGQPIHVWVEYQASSRLVRCYLSHHPQRPLAPTLSTRLNLFETLDQPQSIYVGFAGSTGNAWQKHDVLDARIQTLFE